MGNVSFFLCFWRGSFVGRLGLFKKYIVCFDNGNSFHEIISKHNWVGLYNPQMIFRHSSQNVAYGIN